MTPTGKLLLILLLAAGFGAALAADGEAGQPGDRAAFEAALHYRTGEIRLGDGIASLHLSPAFRYLQPADTARLLTEGWGNPEGEGTLGRRFKRGKPGGST